MCSSRRGAGEAQARLLEAGRELTDTSSGLRLPRGMIIPGRSLPNPYFKTSKDGGSLHEPPGVFGFLFVWGFFCLFVGFLSVFFAMSCFSDPGKFFLLVNLYISCSCLHQGGFVSFTWIFLAFLQLFPYAQISAVPSDLL